MLEVDGVLKSWSVSLLAGRGGELVGVSIGEQFGDRPEATRWARPAGNSKDPDQTAGLTG
ncbi:hypothetical protein [Streptomyces sp. NPDC001312]|uniref:hypothetical protein n=1 Tax=Streptomyces sp. NPDC001312 TaxID=3364561 RepID=UPI0036824E79